MDEDSESGRSRWAIHPVVDGIAGYSWRLLVIAAAAIASLWLIGRLWVVFVPIVIALFLTRVLVVPAGWLRRRKWPRSLAAAASLLGFLLILGLILGVIGIAVAREFTEIGPTVSQAVDDIERWLVDDSPFDIERSDVERFRRDAGDAVKDSLRSSGGGVVSGAVLAGELLISLLLSLILTFFFLKDGERFLKWGRALVPGARQELAERMAARGWRTLGAYLRGAALLGTMEGIIMTVTLFAVGAKLSAPIGVLTFLAAFVPFAGAFVAGVLAVLVALATGGWVPALIVAAVALIVQQLDNDVLAPIVYGRALEIHPVVVLLAIVGGGALFGIPGSVLAVPVVAVAINMGGEARRRPANDPLSDVDSAPEVANS